MAKYNTKLRDKLVELYSTGKYYISDICEMAGINKHSWYEWKKNKPDFSNALKKADDERIDNIKIMAMGGLEKLITLYEYTEVTKELKGTTKEELVTTKTVDKFTLPNAAAVIFTLKKVIPEVFSDEVDADQSINITYTRKHRK